ncbi:MAG TPA: hypothetical protein VHH52_11290, partial [Pseudonocardiaceae bacterium]|nr:hypothetical protein [Pseudonocardiaceae bacterium]
PPRWALCAATVAVLVAAAGAGLLVRQLQPTASADGAASIAHNAPPRAPAPGPGPTTVALVEDVAVHPDAERVRRVLQRYFDAINAGDYKLWRSTVTPQHARDTGEAAWRDQYRSTLDGSIVLHRLEPRAGGGLVALLSFTSLQDPADAPPDMPVRCLRWWVSYPLIGDAGELRLSPSSPSTSLRVPC